MHAYLQMNLATLASEAESPDMSTMEIKHWTTETFFKISFTESDTTGKYLTSESWGNYPKPIVDLTDSNMARGFSDWSVSDRKASKIMRPYIADYE